MTGRGRALADSMKPKKVDVLCVQETRWKGNKAKELGEGYKLIYGGANGEGRNGIGIILSRAMKDLVTKVNRESDRIMWIRLALEDFSMNIFSVYAPQEEALIMKKNSFGRTTRPEKKLMSVKDAYWSCLAEAEKGKITTQRRIKWFKLKENDFQQEFKDEF
ncbi:uncharacterized protein LOC119569459 [Penaeus monodon]|uniref:uncharacterized protein LOC119569459 n=1 Tax=Penaeus monodon TaxID=6687 RepID=UPI0018A6D90D|nr:uncharacterized protein LOC119569459 [Penaeus monodon]